MIIFIHLRNGISIKKQHKENADLKNSKKSHVSTCTTLNHAAHKHSN